jgi:hypothetical protein
LWVKANEVNYLAVSSLRVHRSEGRLNIYKLKERVRTCKDRVIGREIPTVLKIDMDNIILELCNSFVLFASPLLKEKTIKFNRYF